MIEYTETYHHLTLVGESKNTHNFASKQDIQHVTYYVLTEYNNLLFFVNMIASYRLTMIKIKSHHKTNHFVDLIVMAIT